MKPLILARFVLAAIALSAAPAFADWKSFFHGDPPPFVKAPPPKQLAVVSSVAGLQPDPQVESFMRALANAVMARDGSVLLPRLSERYAINDMPYDAKASQFMVQAIGKMPGPTQIVIQSVEVNGAVRIAKAEFHYVPERVSTKTFRFDTNGNLLSSDLFTLVRG
jgi:hypothetical protein